MNIRALRGGANGSYVSDPGSCSLRLASCTEDVSGAQPQLIGVYDGSVSYDQALAHPLVLQVLNAVASLQCEAVILASSSDPLPGSLSGYPTPFSIVLVV